MSAPGGSPLDADVLQALGARLYGDHPNRKAPSYLREYARLLHGRRDAPLRILELGIATGTSLLLWHEYLPKATIVGVDILPAPDCVIGKERIICLRGSQDDPHTLDRAAALAGGPFDLIVDDASHIGYLTKRAFAYLFPRWLLPGGHYVIEDFGTGMMVEYPDGEAFVEPRWDDAEPGTRRFESHQSGMVGVVKQLIDHMMTELIAGRPAAFAIARVTILTNIAVVEKEPTATVGPPPDPYPQVRTGRTSPDLPALADAIRQQDARLAAAEAQLGRLLQALRPLLRLARWLGVRRSR